MFVCDVFNVLQTRTLTKDGCLNLSFVTDLHAPRMVYFDNVQASKWCKHLYSLTKWYVMITRPTSSCFTCLEPRSNWSQYKTNGALMHSNSSVNQLLLYDVITLPANTFLNVLLKVEVQWALNQAEVCSYIRSWDVQSCTKFQGPNVSLSVALDWPGQSCNHQSQCVWS